MRRYRAPGTHHSAPAPAAGGAHDEHAGQRGQGRRASRPQPSFDAPTPEPYQPLSTGELSNLEQLLERVAPLQQPAAPAPGPCPVLPPHDRPQFPSAPLPHGKYIGVR